MQAVVEKVRAKATPVEGKEDIAHIATISAADPEIGNLIAEVMDKVGKDGVITVEESRDCTSRPSTSKACSSIVATSPPTSSPTPIAWKPSSKSPISHHR